MLDKKKITEFAQELVAAEDGRKAVDPLTGRAELTVEDAYKIQMEVIEIKKRRGEKIIGKKIGLTSKRMQQLLGVYEPDYGHILHKLMVGDGSPIILSELIQPKIEVEIAFILQEDLTEPWVTGAEVLRCTAGVLPSFEVIDSRIKDWKIKIQDTIADNASIGRVILGSPLCRVYGLDLRTVGLVVRKNGEIVDMAAGASVLGSPAESVAWLANKLSEYGEHLKKGDVVISGSLIAAFPIKEGDVIQAEFGGGLGSVTAYVRK